MEELLEIALNRIAELEKKLERYFEILEFENELDFILKGRYIPDSELTQILEGTY